MRSPAPSPPAALAAALAQVVSQQRQRRVVLAAAGQRGDVDLSDEYAAVESLASQVRRGQRRAALAARACLPSAPLARLLSSSPTAA